MTIRLRFVRGNTITSDLIALREETAMPFTPSHVECVVPEDWPDEKLRGRWLGQHIDGGMQAREPGYDAAHIALLPDGKPCETFVDLLATLEQIHHFYSHAIKSIGQPYDWEAILGFALPDIHLHKKFHAICSAKMVLLLRGCGWFKWPLAVPAHLVDPRDLLLILSAMVEIRH